MILESVNRTFSDMKSETSATFFFLSILILRSCFNKYYSMEDFTPIKKIASRWNTLDKSEESIK